MSFLNTVPLIDGLDVLADIDVCRTVPSGLLSQLLHEDVDIALCSSIDYQRSPEPLVIVPVGILGCDGPTLTVRLYSSVPIHQLTRVYCDTDSHTSVALLRILLAEMFAIQPEMIAYDAREHVAGNKPMEWPEAVLLIGDKVVTDSPPAVRYPHQLDLGAAWANLTALPFVFAVWMARRDAGHQRLAAIASVLDRQRRFNATRLDSIVHHATSRGPWPADLATHYLRDLLAFEWTPQREQGLTRFFELAHTHGLIPDIRPIELFGAA